MIDRLLLQLDLLVPFTFCIITSSCIRNNSIIIITNVCQLQCEHRIDVEKWQGGKRNENDYTTCCSTLYTCTQGTVLVQSGKEYRSDECVCVCVCVKHILVICFIVLYCIRCCTFNSMMFHFCVLVLYSCGVIRIRII